VNGSNVTWWQVRAEVVGGGLKVFFPQQLLAHSEIQQRTQRHIPTDPGETIKIKDPHNNPHLSLTVHAQCH
jgi:hypothetical protein